METPVTARLLRFYILMIVAFMLAWPTAWANPKIKVVTTIFPLYDFARQVGGDKVDVSMLLPPGVEVHSFEPRPGDIVALSKADIFIYTGSAMEPWAEDILKGVSPHHVLAVDTSRGIDLMDAADHAAEPEDLHRHGGKDPHIWLDPVLAQTMIDTIARAFVSRDPLNEGLYLSNAQSYKNKLKDLHQHIEIALASCEIRTIIYGGHFAFGYFARRYGLTQVSPYNGFSPDTEPSPQRIRAIIDTIRRLDSRVIYYEEMIDPRVARVIALETGAHLEMLSGAHNVPKNALSTTTYLEIMEANVLKLKAGLRCP